MPASKPTSKDVHAPFLPSHLLAQDAHHARCTDVDRCGCARWSCVDSDGGTGGEQRYQRYDHGCWTGRRAQGSSDGAEYRHEPYGERDEQCEWIFRVSKPATREVYADGHGTRIPDDEQHGVLDPDGAASPRGYGAPGGRTSIRSASAQSKSFARQAACRPRSSAARRVAFWRSQHVQGRMPSMEARSSFFATTSWMQIRG